MQYLDIWMYDSTNRMKVFFFYLLIFIIIFVFSDVMIYFYTKSTYKPMEKYELNLTSPEVTITEAISSNVNGTVKGKIKNNTDAMIVEKYLKFDFYTPRDVNIGTKYLKIENLQEDREKEFELGFKYENVSYVKISVAADDDLHKATPEELEEIPAFGPAGIFKLLLLGRLFV